jgi:hypothetical protein
MGSSCEADELSESLGVLSVGSELSGSAIADMFMQSTDCVESEKVKAIEEVCVDEFRSLGIGCREVVVEFEPGMDLSKFADGLIVDVEVLEPEMAPVVDCTTDLDPEAFMVEEDNDDVLLAKLDAELGPGWAVEVSRGKKSNEFFGPDKNFREKLLAGGDNPSKKMDSWALNRVADFMKCLFWSWLPCVSARYCVSFFRVSRRRTVACTLVVQ